MRAISLIYHDVVERVEHHKSGFPGSDAALYKLESGHFKDHLKALSTTVRQKPVNIFSLSSQAEGRMPFLLTFDDGGISAYTCIADMLEEIGWRGHFFIATGYIGSQSFMNRDQILELHRRGHVIGTHSQSHPLRMASCSWNELLWEWKTSVEILSDILGEKVTVASLPGGHYSRKVAEAASLSGIEVLFTSEPVKKSYYVDGCQVLGRYSIQRSTPPHIAAELASGSLAASLKQYLFWNTKKMAKAFGGKYYSKAREFILRQAGDEG